MANPLKVLGLPACGGLYGAPKLVHHQYVTSALYSKIHTHTFTLDTLVYAHRPTHPHTYVLADTHSHMRVHTHTHINMYTHTFTLDTLVHAHRPTHTHTHTHQHVHTLHPHPPAGSQGTPAVGCLHSAPSHCTALPPAYWTSYEGGREQPQVVGQGYCCHRLDCPLLLHHPHHPHPHPHHCV